LVEDIIEADIDNNIPVSKMLAGWQQIGSKFDQNPTPEP